MGSKKKAKKKVAKKKISRRGPMTGTRRARASSSGGGGPGSEFSAPIIPMPTNPVYPPRDYEECASLVSDALAEHEDSLPVLALNSETMAQALVHAKALQGDEERLNRALVKAGGARVAYDDKVWRVCLKIYELTKTLADDNPELAERFAFLGEFIRARHGGGTKGPPGTP